MDKVSRYRACIHQLLQTYATHTHSYGDIETQVIEEYENSLQAIAHAVESKNKTLWFLIYVAGLSMLTTAGLLGFLTARFF